LVKFRLERIAADAVGWNALYRDPCSGRFSEHTYPRSEDHDGDPPMLRAISASEAKSKYGVSLLLSEAQEQQQQ
jgi:hypothetical protein